LLNGRAYRDHLEEASLIWMTPGENYFIPLKDMDQWVPDYCRYQMFTNIAPSKEADRALECVKNIESLNLEKFYDKVYLCGDGNVLLKLKEWFIAEGYAQEQIITETFFHHEVLKAPSAKV